MVDGVDVVVEDETQNMSLTPRKVSVLPGLGSILDTVSEDTAYLYLLNVS